MKNLTRNNGFTLVEIIVVLVIIAILAAAGIPAMLGFIGEARGKALVAEARLGYQAAQATYTEFALSDYSGAIVADGAFTFGDGTSYQTATRGSPGYKFNAMVYEDVNPDDFDLTFTEGKLSQLVYEKTGTDWRITLVPGDPALVEKVTAA